jgi:hypothetical protein
MTEEEKEVVQYFKQFIPFIWWKNPDENGRLKRDIGLANKIDVVLNLIQNQQKEIEKLRNKNKDLLRKLRNRVKEVKKLSKYSLYKKEFSRLNNTIEKKDKIIDLMTDELTCDEFDICCYECTHECEKDYDQLNTCIKQYFESKVEHENT